MADWNQCEIDCLDRPRSEKQTSNILDKICFVVQKSTITLVLEYWTFFQKFME